MSLRAWKILHLSERADSSTIWFYERLTPWPSLKRVRDLASELPENERAALAHDLLSSLDGPADADAQQAWEAEITKRLDELMTGNARTLDVDETLGRVDAQYV